jgi:hypothetical protein
VAISLSPIEIASAGFASLTMTKKGGTYMPPPIAKTQIPKSNLSTNPNVKIPKIVDSSQNPESSRRLY